MTTKTVEIEDNLSEIIESVQEDIKNLIIEYIKDNQEKPDLSDLDYSGSVHEIIDGSVPIYTREIDGLFYLYGSEFEAAFDNAGIGEKEDKNWPMGWKPAAIYCYIEQEVYSWFNDNIDEIFEENYKEEIEEEEEDQPVKTIARQP
jgi:hypothetical protein